MNHKLLLIITVFAGMLASTACSRDTVDITDPTPVITLSLEGPVGQERFTLNIEPDEYAVSYSYVIATGEDRDAFKQGTLADIVEVAGAEATIVIFGDLQPATSYTVFARALDSEGQPGPVASIAVITEEMVITNDIIFKTQYTTSSSAGVDITLPKDEFASFDYAIGLPGDKSKFESKELDTYSTRLESYEYTANFFELAPATDYLFFMRAYDRRGVSTKIYEIPLRTLASGEGPEVEVDILTQDIFRGEYIFTPNDLCGKFTMITTPAGGYDDLIHNDFHWRGDLMAMIASWALSESAPNQPFRTYTNSDVLDFSYVDDIKMTLEADFEYEYFFLLYDDRGRPFGIQRFSNTTSSYDDTLAPGEVGIAISNITTTGATFTFTADSDTIGFYFDTVEADWYDNMKENDPAWNKNYLRDLFRNRGFYFAYTGEQKKIAFIETSVPQPGYRCYIAVCPINANGVSDPDWGKVQLVGFTTATE